MNEVDVDILRDIMFDHNLCHTQKERLEKIIERYTPRRAIEKAFHFHCPKCMSRFDGELIKYCPECGQAILWEVEE